MKREGQAQLGPHKNPSQKIRKFLKNISDSRMGLFLGMESGGDKIFF